MRCSRGSARGAFVLRRSELCQANRRNNCVSNETRPRSSAISGVAGLDDEVEIPVLTTTCSGCHRARNVGSPTSVRFMHIGVAAEANRASFLPLLTVVNRTNGEVRKTTELGRALTTRPGRTLARCACSACAGLRAAVGVTTDMRSI